MRDIGLTRDEAQAEFDRQWGLVKLFGAQMSERQAKLAPRHHAYDGEWLKLERSRLDAVYAANRIKESGVVPWMKNDHLGSFNSNMESWASRVMMRSYRVDSRDEHDPVLVITSETRQHQQSLTFNKKSAEALRDQLIYELEKWDES